MSFIVVNGQLQKAAEPALLITNRGYRYGDGLFETIKVSRGRILLSDLHFDRLFKGLALLQYEIRRFFDRGKLETEILQLCEKNNCAGLGRVRLSVFRGNGGLYDPGDRTVQYAIECWPLDESANELNENGLVIDIYPGARKSTDDFSALKSANAIPYSMAAIYARDHKLNDCLLLNSDGRLADSSIANLFIIKNNQVLTPGPGQGAVQGVMRRYLLEQFPALGLEAVETVISPADLAAADELFLTNAIKGIRWVRQCGQKEYTHTRTSGIYQSIVRTIWS